MGESDVEKNTDLHILVGTQVRRKLECEVKHTMSISIRSCAPLISSQLRWTSSNSSLVHPPPLSQTSLLLSC